MIPKCVNQTVYRAARATCRQEILSKALLEDAGRVGRLLFFCLFVNVFCFFFLVGAFIPILHIVFFLSTADSRVCDTFLVFSRFSGFVDR